MGWPVVATRLSTAIQRLDCAPTYHSHQQNNSQIKGAKQCYSNFLRVAGISLTRNPLSRSSHSALILYSKPRSLLPCGASPHRDFLRIARQPNPRNQNLCITRAKDLRIQLLERPQQPSSTFDQTSAPTLGNFWNSSIGPVYWGTDVQ